MTDSNMKGKVRAKKTRKPPSDDDLLRRTRFWSFFFEFDGIHSDKEFAHFIATDAVSISVYFFAPAKEKKKKPSSPFTRVLPEWRPEMHSWVTERPFVGLDPGGVILMFARLVVLNEIGLLAVAGALEEGRELEMRAEYFSYDATGPTEQYSNRQRRHEIRTPLFEMLARRHMPLEVTMRLKRLSRTTSRHWSFAEMREYIIVRSAFQDLLYDYFSNPVHRIHRWWAFQNTQRSETDLVRRLMIKFGKDVVIAYGDWSSSVQRKGCKPGPTVRLRWLLKLYFYVLDVCEHCTTKLCSWCLHPDAVVEPLEGLQRVRGLRKCNECGTIFGRDDNASTNMGYNGVNFCLNGKWMRIFTRAPAAAAVAAAAGGAVAVAGPVAVAGALVDAAESGSESS